MRLKLLCLGEVDASVVDNLLEYFLAGVLGAHIHEVLYLVGLLYSHHFLSVLLPISLHCLDFHQVNLVHEHVYSLSPRVLVVEAQQLLDVLEALLGRTLSRHS